jgi:membrane protein
LLLLFAKIFRFRGSIIKKGILLKTFFSFLVEIVNKWMDDKCFKLSAALSFYTVVSLAPLIIIAIAIAGYIFGEQAAQGQIVTQIQGLVGQEGAIVVQSILKNANESNSGLILTIVSIVILFFSSTAAFAELNDSLNIIWKVKPKKGRVLKGLIKERILSLALVIGLGFFLLVSLVASALLTALSDFIGKNLSIPIGSINTFNTLFTFIATFFLVSIIYKVLSDVRLAWTDVWLGSSVTTFLFMLGKYFIGYYLGNSTYNSVYGAAGSLAILLLWVYYSAQILFFGAEFTYVFAKRFGKGVVPSEDVEVI